MSEVFLLYEGEIERGRENLRMIMDQNKEVNRWKDSFQIKKGKEKNSFCLVFTCLYLWGLWNI